MTRWLFNLAFSVLFSRKNWRQKTKKLKCEMEKIKGSRGLCIGYPKRDFWMCFVMKKWVITRSIQWFFKVEYAKGMLQNFEKSLNIPKIGPNSDSTHPNSRSQVPNLSTIETCKRFHWIRWAPFLYKKHKKTK